MLANPNLLFRFIFMFADAWSYVDKFILHCIRSQDLPNYFKIGMEHDFVDCRLITSEDTNLLKKTPDEGLILLQVSICL